MVPGTAAAVAAAAAAAAAAAIAAAIAAAATVNRHSSFVGRSTCRTSIRYQV